jgi:conjugative transposon TraJ protein
MNRININFEKLFLDMFNTLSVHVNIVGRIAVMIIGIATLFYIVSKIWPALFRNEAVDFYPLLRPAVICILCMNFQSLVVTPIQWTLSPLRKQSNAWLTKTDANVEQKITEIVQKAQAQEHAESKKKLEEEMKEREKNEDTFGGLKNMLGSVGLAISSTVEDLKMALMKGLLCVCGLFKLAVFLILNFVRIFCLCLLGMLGPIAFAFSIFPGFGNGITHWLAKYISIYLWLPIFNIITILLTQAELALTEQVVGAAGTTGIWGIMVLLIVVYIMGAFVYLSVPTFATWIIAGGASSAEMGTMMKGAAVAGGVAAGVTGWAGGRAGGLATSSNTAAALGGVAGAVAGGAVGAFAAPSSAVSGAMQGAQNHSSTSGKILGGIKGGAGGLFGSLAGGVGSGAKKGAATGTAVNKGVGKGASFVKKILGIK